MNNPRNILFEVCCTCLEDAQSALRQGAGRVELCSCLECGGITPTWLHRLAEEPELREPKFGGLSFLDRSHVLIRCRPGDFVYTEPEVEQMCQSIRSCRQAGVKGVVIGALTPEGHPDVAALKHMITEATEPLTAAISTTDDSQPVMRPPLTLVFHRAFDRGAEPLGFLETIIGLGFNALLTSGQGTTAEEGIPLLAQLVRQAAGRIQIMAGKGVTLQNVTKIIRQTRVTAVHMSYRPGIDRVAHRIRSGAPADLHKSPERFPG